ncbi:MAG TPA: bifunctional helix-turn-helix transcriptional regulator/GNAT family N-acetyltransferase [Thermoanaerobaculia bacterium]|nr:bifunctional helix-turn-helix transcriptional regulator/GNAT family N-acetyltransferase [Thermoanaerobaculia bacterium]
MDLIKELGHLALASRLKRLGDRLQQEVSEVYADQGLGFRARWFPVLAALSSSSPLAVSELAASLGLTHTAIAQISREMETDGLVASTDDPLDGRRRLLALTERGSRAVARLTPLWAEIRAATAELVAESGHELLEALTALEARLEQRPLAARLEARLGRLEIEVWDPERAPELAACFRALNLAWIEALFTPEEEDLRRLADPAGEIVGRGGEVLFAHQAGEVVGTCALLFEDQVAELSKMAIAPAWQGRGLGRRLAVAALDRARRHGCSTVFLFTSDRLRAAQTLYRSLGFHEAERPPVARAGFERDSIVLVLEIQKEDPR